MIGFIQVYKNEAIQLTSILKLTNRDGDWRPVLRFSPQNFGSYYTTLFFHQLIGVDPFPPPCGINI